MGGGGGIFVLQITGIIVESLIVGHMVYPRYITGAPPPLPNIKLAKGSINSNSIDPSSVDCKCSYQYNMYKYLAVGLLVCVIIRRNINVTRTC